MNKADVFAKVTAVVVDQLGVEESEIEPNSRFIEDLGADSLDLVELVIAAEEDFDVDRIPDEDAEKLLTVGGAVDYICNRLGIKG